MAAERYDPLPDLAAMVAAGRGWRGMEACTYALRITEQLGLGEDDSPETVAAELGKAIGDGLRAENAALRELLTAASAAADVPMPADAGDMQAHYVTCARRADLIAIYARADQSLDVVRSQTERLNAEAARPLRYTPRGAAS